MEDIFNDVLLGLGAILISALIYLLSPLILAMTFGKLLVKGLVVATVFYFIGQSSDWLLGLLESYAPIHSNIMAFACQLGLWEGLDLFVKIIFTHWASTWIILAIIGG